MTDLLQVGGGDSGFGGSFGGAAAGAIIGSWFGNGWGGFGGRDGGGNCGCGGFGTQILNDGVNAIQSSLNSMNSSLSSGLCNIGYQTLDQTSRTNLAMMQGFATLGHDNCQNTNSIVSAINTVGFNQQQCCCATQNAIREEACATRQVIQNNLISDLQTKLSDVKSDNAALKSQLYTTNVVNGQTAVILGAIERLRPTTTAATGA